MAKYTNTKGVDIKPLVSETVKADPVQDKVDDDILVKLAKSVEKLAKSVEAIKVQQDRDRERLNSLDIDVLRAKNDGYEAEDISGVPREISINLQGKQVTVRR